MFAGTGGLPGQLCYQPGQLRSRCTSSNLISSENNIVRTKVCRFYSFVANLMQLILESTKILPPLHTDAEWPHTFCRGVLIACWSLQILLLVLCNNHTEHYYAGVSLVDPFMQVMRCKSLSTAFSVSAWWMLLSQLHRYLCTLSDSRMSSPTYTIGTYTKSIIATAFRHWKQQLLLLCLFKADPAADPLERSLPHQHGKLAHSLSLLPLLPSTTEQNKKYYLTYHSCYYPHPYKVLY